MEHHRCECGQIFDTAEEYLEHLKQKIQKQNQKIIEAEDKLLEYYDEVGI